MVRVPVPAETLVVRVTTAVVPVFCQVYWRVSVTSDIPAISNEKLSAVLRITGSYPGPALSPHAATPSRRRPAIPRRVSWGNDIGSPEEVRCCAQATDVPRWRPSPKRPGLQRLANRVQRVAGPNCPAIDLPGLAKHGRSDLRRRGPVGGTVPTSRPRGRARSCGAAPP